jgi:Secretion system C-terminal sorting domain
LLFKQAFFTFFIFKQKSMKRLYSAKTILIGLFFLPVLTIEAQVPSVTGPGICQGVIADFNTGDNGYNSPSIYGSIFDSSLYYHAGRHYWTDYLPPLRTTTPGFPRVLNIISPPYSNPNPNGTFNIGFYYIVPNPQADRFQVRIISVTQTPMGTVTNVEATSGVQFFSSWSTPTPYLDGTTTVVPDPTPLMNGFQGNVCIRLIDADIVNGPNTNFRVEISYIINEPLFAGFDNLSIGPFNIPLPVNFIGLVANRGSDNTINLKWDVSEEVDVREYQVERSTNGSSFTLEGSVTAKGKSLYAFTNFNVSPKTLFYRIKSVDLDGRFKYSGIIRLPGNSSSSFAETLKVYPIPATDDILVEHKRLNTRAKMTITSFDGKVLRMIIPAQGSSHTPVNISGLTPGMYFLQLDDGAGYAETIKLIKN